MHVIRGLWCVCVLLVASRLAAAAEPPASVDVFVGGQDGYFAYRIPALITSKQGTLLAFCEGRKTTLSDDGNNDLVLRRSTDSGKTGRNCS